MSKPKPPRRSFKKDIAARKGGDRYASGKLKPPAPNARVVAQRRALLGAKPGEHVDISQAENALDVALARGWFSKERHRAAETYAGLVRQSLGRLPTLKVGQLAGNAALQALRPLEEGLGRSGVTTEADAALWKSLKELEAGKITERDYSRAERAHRAAKIDWARVPAEDIARLFDVIMDSTPPPARDSGHGDGSPDVRSTLQTIWTQLTPGEARQVFDVAVLGSWPAWLMSYITGRQLHRDDRQRLYDLERGLDKVLAVISPKRPPRAPDLPLGVIERQSTAPGREEHIEYVTPEGRVLFDVVRRPRRT